MSNERINDEEVITNIMKSGDKFGEDEIVTSDRRPATIISQDTTQLFVVHKKVRNERRRLLESKSFIQN